MKSPSIRFLPWVVTALGVALLFAKLYAYSLTRSTAVLSDAMEGIVNIVTGIASIFVMAIAHRPPDENHPYGHGKVEYFSAAFEGGLIAFAALVILGSVARSFFWGPQVHELDVGLVVISFAGLANGAMGLFLVKRSRKVASAALEASGHHLLSDFWTTLGVVIGLVLVKVTGWIWFDPLTAALVALHLLYVGVRLVRGSVGDLMDAEDQKWLQKLQKAFELSRVPGIIRIHGTRILRSGRFHHVDLHIVVPEFWPVKQAHEEVDEFEKQVLKNYEVPGELHAHLDPCRKAYCLQCELLGCPIRVQTFQKKSPFTLVEIISPVESN